MHYTSDCSIDVHKADVIPVNFNGMSRLVFQREVQVGRSHIPYNIDIIIFVPIFVHIVLIY